MVCRAIKNGKGLHSKKEAPIHRVADISGVSVSFGYVCTGFLTQENKSISRIRILKKFVANLNIQKKGEKMNI